MSREGEFLIYCMEIYKAAKNMTGKQICTLFQKYQLNEYIRKYFEALHTTGEKYIINDLDLFITAGRTDISDPIE